MTNTHTENLRSILHEIKALLAKAEAKLDFVIEAQPRQSACRPPQPQYNQRVARRLWLRWDKLKAFGEFNVNDAWKIATGNATLPVTCRIDSFYSATLSRWAKEGFIELIEKGRGPIPAKYKISD